MELSFWKRRKNSSGGCDSQEKSAKKQKKGRTLRLEIWGDWKVNSTVSFLFSFPRGLSVCKGIFLCCPLFCILYGVRGGKTRLRLLSYLSKLCSPSYPPLWSSLNVIKGLGESWASGDFSLDSIPHANSLKTRRSQMQPNPQIHLQRWQKSFRKRRRTCFSHSHLHI